MSDEAMRRLERQRTSRFRSSTSCERGTRADEEPFDLSQHVYPTARPAVTTHDAHHTPGISIQPASFVVIGVVMLLLGLYLCLSPIPPERNDDRAVISLSVAVSILLMEAAIVCGIGIVAIRRPCIVRWLLAATGTGLLCLSRAAFLRPHDAKAAVRMDRYGGGLLILAGVLALNVV